MNLSERQLLQKGKYCLTKVVGKGGFGITYHGVWFAEVKGSLGTMITEVPVCIKEYFFKDYCYRDEDSKTVRVHSETGQNLFVKFKEKLIKEAKILSEVQHPHIVNVLEVFEENNTTYIAMEYIEGCSLKYMLEQNGMLSEEKALKYIHQIGQALAFVHQKQILHLDIKPSNILIDKYDNAKLIDFGVSKRFDTQGEETSTTVLTLSKGFASIEQYDDNGMQSFTPCPDIYSLGATLYNLLTGVIPTESILRVTKDLVLPRDLNESISKKTQDVILKAMRLVAEDRYQSIDDMLECLDKPIENADETNDLREGVHNFSDEETLIRKTQPLLPAGDDDEETIIYNKQVDGEKDVEKKKKRGLTPIAILLLFTLTPAYFFFFKDKTPAASSVEATSVNDNNNSESVGSETIVVDTTQYADEPSEENIAPTPEVEPAKPEQVSEAEAEKRAENAEPITEVQEQTTTTEPEEDLPTEITAPSPKEVHDSLLMEGKRKMGEQNFESAEDDFARAKEVMLSEEVIRLEIECEELKTEHLLAQYEIKMPLGNYQIVRKKSNQKYGAINSRGIETIPCKYLSVGKTETGRAFEREDNLFDIYDENGNLMNEGQTYY